MSFYLQQFILQFAEFYNIEPRTHIKFENRDILLQKIKLADQESYFILNDFVEGQLNLELIKNNQKLGEENPTIWKIALLNAKEEAYNSSLAFRIYCRKKRIPLNFMIKRKEAVNTALQLK